MFLLDTNACIAVLKRSSQPLLDRLRKASPGEIRICAITKGELLYGARHSARVAENLRALEVFWAPYASLSFDDRSAEEYAAIRADLAARGRPVGPNDLMIAAIARTHDLTVITRNVGEFSRVPGLRVENWEAA